MIDPNLYADKVDEVERLSRELHSLRVLLGHISAFLKCGCLETSLCDDHDHTILNQIEVKKL
jgi:hypothetical protein